MATAPCNRHRHINRDPFWPFGHCETCGKNTMYDCTICGQCATEANDPNVNRKRSTMTTVTIGFLNPEYDAYEDLSIEEAREAVMEELKKSIQDQGSDGYEPIYGEWEGDREATDEEHAEAHQRGIEVSAKAQFGEIWSTLLLHGEARLPGNVTITYKEER